MKNNELEEEEEEEGFWMCYAPHILSVGRRRQFFFFFFCGGDVVQSVRDIEEASLASPHPSIHTPPFPPTHPPNWGARFCRDGSHEVVVVGGLRWEEESWPRRRRRRRRSYRSIVVRARRSIPTTHTKGGGVDVVWWLYTAGEGGWGDAAVKKKFLLNPGDETARSHTTSHLFSTLARRHQTIFVCVCVPCLSLTKKKINLFFFLFILKIYLFWWGSVLIGCAVI